jgi:hypothetical protein
MAIGRSTRQFTATLVSGHTAGLKTGGSIQLGVSERSAGLKTGGSMATRATSTNAS